MITLIFNESTALCPDAQMSTTNSILSIVFFMLRPDSFRMTGSREKRLGVAGIELGPLTQEQTTTTTSTAQL